MSAAFLTELPPRPEAILKAVAHGWNTSNPCVRSAISSLEAPSALMTAHWLFPDLEVLINEIPDPDPRVPFDEVAVRAWTYDGIDATPDLPIPNAEFAAAICESVKLEYSLDNYSECAIRLAADFSGLTPCEKIGAMLFLADPPNDEWPWDWLFRGQLLCGLVLSRTDIGEWLPSPEAKHVRDLCYGPVDWTTTAGLFALFDRARFDHNSRTEICDMLFRLLKRPMSPIWFMCAYQPIWQMLQHIPGLESSVKAGVDSMVIELEAPDDE